MDLKIHTLDTAPAGAPLLEGIKADLGFVPNLAASVAESPALLAGFDGLRRAVQSGELSDADREIAGVAVGVAVDSAYGVAFHSTVLAALGVDDTEIERMRSGSSRPTPTCRRLLRSPGDRGQPGARSALPPSFGRLPRASPRRWSWRSWPSAPSPRLVGMVDNLADRVELDEPLVPRAWG